MSSGAGVRVAAPRRRRLALGVLLLALPQMYGVGYPVMDHVSPATSCVGLIVLFLVGKILAASLTLSIGGSGGVFAPSLFIGAMAGMAFGLAARHVFGPAVGSPAMYGVVAMGGVFAGAAQAPLTAIASVVEMTGNFTLTLPVMLACGIAAALSKQLSYGSIYTTKLLRRGIDIERPGPTTCSRRSASPTSCTRSRPATGYPGSNRTATTCLRRRPTSWSTLCGHPCHRRTAGAVRG